MAGDLAIVRCEDDQDGKKLTTLGSTDIQKLRNARNNHSYKQIWTKDAHGGPYKKLELGYQRFETGSTTNFVGNHMTQAAIDLVQAELQEQAAPIGTTKLLTNTPCDNSNGPTLLSISTTASTTPSPTHDTSSSLIATQSIHTINTPPDIDTLRRMVRQSRKQNQPLSLESKLQDPENALAPTYPHVETESCHVNSEACIELYSSPQEVVEFGRQQLLFGNTRAAITAFTYAIDSGGSGSIVYEALVARAAVYEDVEKYQLAALDVERALELLLLKEDNDEELNRTKKAYLVSWLQRMRRHARAKEAK